MIMKSKNIKLPIIFLGITLLVLIGFFILIRFMKQDDLSFSAPMTRVESLDPIVIPTEFITTYCDCSLAITTTSNIEFIVTNPFGQQSGFQQNKADYINEIPNASYGLEEGIMDASGQGIPLQDLRYFSVNDPLNGVYILKIIPQQSGTYNLTIALVWGPENSISYTYKSVLGENQADFFQLSLPEGLIEKERN